MRPVLGYLLYLAAQAVIVFGTPTPNNRCHKTDVLIIGAGSSGIAAARELALHNVTNFVILEYNDEIGGRVRHTRFGQRTGRDGSYTVELGANWIHGVGSDNGHENPIWTLAKKYGLNTIDFSETSTASFDQNGPANLSSKFDEFSTAFQATASLEPITEGEDLSYRAGLRLVGWNSDLDPHAQAAEIWGFDGSWAVSPDMASLFYANQDEDNDSGGNEADFGPKSEFVLDDRGYNYILRQEMNTFMSMNDSRLHLNTIVQKVSVQDDSVLVETKDGDCFQAKQAICTFSVGVLQHSSLAGVQGPVKFDPPLPLWKQDAIAGFGMGTYTKIFMQFDPDAQFWPNDTENFVYASPTTRGYFPFWQSLSMDNYLPDSGIIFATTLTGESQRLERQSNDDTMYEALNVLAEMFAVEDPQAPINFMYPRWGQEPWVYGSYSFWPTGYTTAQHERLKANVGRLWFAGEHLNKNNQATVHGAWMSGQETGKKVAACLSLGGEACTPHGLT